MPVVKEGTPNGEMKNGFKRIITAFLQAYREGVAENVREHDDYVAEIKEEILHQATGQQKQAAT